MRHWVTPPFGTTNPLPGNSYFWRTGYYSFLPIRYSLTEEFTEAVPHWTALGKANPTALPVTLVFPFTKVVSWKFFRTQLGP